MRNRTRAEREKVIVVRMPARMRRLSIQKLVIASLRHSLVILLLRQ